MSRDDSKNSVKIFTDYKNEVNTAVQCDTDSKYLEALIHYQKALEISNQIINLPQTSYVVAIRQKNLSVQQRISELMKIQQFNFPNQSPLNLAQYPQEATNAQQNQFEEPPKTEIPIQNQQIPYSTPQNPIQNRPKLYENPPKTEYPNVFQQNVLWNQQKYDMQNQNLIQQRPYENPPKTEVPNAFQQIPLYNMQKYDILNQNQQIHLRQNENPPIAENQNQQKPFYNYPKLENQNQQKQNENPPKAQVPIQAQQKPYTAPQKYDMQNPVSNQPKQCENPKMQNFNQAQQKPYSNAQKSEVNYQNQSKPTENPPTSDMQYPNSQNYSQKAPKSFDPYRKGLRYPKHTRSNSPQGLRRNPSSQNSNTKAPILSKNGDPPKNPSPDHKKEEIDLLPKKSGAIDLNTSSNNNNNNNDITSANTASVRKSSKKHKRSSSPQNTSTLSSSKIDEEFYSFEFDINDQNNQQVSKKQSRPKRSKSSRSTTKKNIQSPKPIIPPLLSNLVVQIDMFKKEKEIGSGSFGLVYLVTEKASGAKYALKEIESPIINRLSEQQLLREIELMNLARHPLVCHLRGFSLISQSFSGRHPFIVTDYYPNGSLGNVIAGQRKFDATQKLIVLYGIANAMAYLHNIEIVHRDLKPDNVLLDQNDYPIVCDFGLSKLMEAPNLRQTTAAGSPVYMAPELMKRQIYSNSIDVYAYAYICFELLTETTAFNEVTNVATLVNLVCNDKKRPSMSMFDESVLPKIFKKLISKCWSDSPEERPSFNIILNYYQKGILRIQGVDERKFKAFMHSFAKL